MTSQHSLAAGPASLDQDLSGDEVPAPNVSADSGSTLFQSIPKTLNQAELLDILTMMTMMQWKGATPDVAAGPATVSSPRKSPPRSPSGSGGFNVSDRSRSPVRRSHSTVKTSRLNHCFKCMNRIGEDSSNFVGRKGSRFSMSDISVLISCIYSETDCFHRPSFHLARQGLLCCVTWSMIQQLIHPHIKLLVRAFRMERPVDL